MTQASWIYDRLYLPYKLAGLVDAAKELGVEPASVLRGTGFAPDAMSSFGMKSSVAQFVKGCENATRLVDDSSLPFRVGQRMHLSAYGVYGYTLLSSPSIRMFLDNAVKYHRLATPVFRVEWGAFKERFVWRLLKPTVSIENAHCRNFLLAQQVFQHALHMQDGLGEQYRPLYVLLPEGLRAFESMFGAHLNCPVSFWAGTPTSITMPRCWIAQRPSPTSFRLTLCKRSAIGKLRSLLRRPESLTASIESSANAQRTYRR